jgi:virulence-associated protein VapD
MSLEITNNFVRFFFFDLDVMIAHQSDLEPSFQVIEDIKRQFKIYRGTEIQGLLIRLKLKFI